MFCPESAIFLFSPVSCPQAVPRVSPAASLFLRFPTSFKPWAHLLSASSCFTILCALLISSNCHSPLLPPLASLPSFTLCSLSLLQLYMNCFSRCPIAE